ncbi:MAG: iron-containing alcohol dehydrogenase [Eubacteriales bacterium]
MSDFFMPQNNFLGVGSIDKISEEISSQGYTKCLIITDGAMYKSKTFQRVLRTLVNANTNFKVFKDTQPNPTIENVEEAFDLIKDSPCEFIISIGGGSAHDLAKAVAILSTNGGKISDYVGVNKLKKNTLPLIAINTTAGTGSEVTSFTIITDAKNKVKLAIVDKRMTPWISVNDPLTMVTMPKGLTAATGLDALTHAIEAYVSTNSSPMTDACALKAINLIGKNLKLAYDNGENIEAREKMAEAEFLAGVAFSNASLGYVHAIAHQLGGIYDLPHGLCNAVLLPYVIKFNGSNLEGNKFGEIAYELGIKVFNKMNRFSHKMLITHLFNLNKSLNIPTNLKALDIKQTDFKTIAENALKDPCSLTNPVQTDVEGIIKILRDAF